MRVCWNRQTGTFEGRVSLTYGFKSRLPHQIEKTSQMTGLFYLVPTVVCDNRRLRAGYPLRSTRRRNPQLVPPSHILFLCVGLKSKK